VGKYLSLKLNEKLGSSSPTVQQSFTTLRRQRFFQEDSFGMLPEVIEQIITVAFDETRNI